MVVHCIDLRSCALVGIKEEERGTWRGGSGDRVTQRLVVALQRLLEWCARARPSVHRCFVFTRTLRLFHRRLEESGFERTEGGFVCPSFIPTRKDRSGKAPAIVCRLDVFVYGNRLGFYCTAAPRAAISSSRIHNTKRAMLKRAYGSAVDAPGTRHAPAGSHSYGLSPSDFLSQVLIDQLGFNTAPSDEYDSCL